MFHQIEPQFHLPGGFIKGQSLSSLFVKNFFEVDWREAYTSGLLAYTDAILIGGILAKILHSHNSDPR